MRKPWWFLCVVLCMLILIGCQGEEAQTQESITTESETLMTTQDPTESTDGGDSEEESQMAQIQEKLYQEGALCAVAYVGYNGGSFAEIQEGFETDNLLEELPILAELKEENFFANEGSELYLIIPRDDVTMTIHTEVMDEESGEIVFGEVLHTQEKPEPVLLRGNISDLFANIAVLLEIPGEVSEKYSPSLSLKDGYLLVDSDYVFDISPYETLGMYADPTVGSAEDLVCSWFAEAPNTAGDTMFLELVLKYDGTASYGYGLVNSELYEFFEGNWFCDDDGILCLSLLGGPVGEIDSHYDFYGEFRWEYYDYGLSLEHVDGNSLIFGLEGGSIEFQSVHETAMDNLWCASEYITEAAEYFYYDLELLEDGSCSYLVHNGEGVTFEAYEGTWSLENGILQLNAKMFYGQNYQEDTVQEISGSYRAVIDADAWLKLSLISGHALKTTMFEGSWEYFQPTVSYG